MRFTKNIIVSVRSWSLRRVQQLCSTYTDIHGLYNVRKYIIWNFDGSLWIPISSVLYFAHSKLTSISPPNWRRPPWRSRPCTVGGSWPCTLTLTSSCGAPGPKRWSRCRRPQSPGGSWKGKWMLMLLWVPAGHWPIPKYSLYGGNNFNTIVH